MNTINPYSLPAADLSNEPIASTELASRWRRLGASIIDGLLSMIWAVPMMFASKVWDHQKQGIESPFLTTLAMFVVSFLMFTAMHGYFLHKNGQTIGKKLVGIRITDLNGDTPPLFRILGLRYLPVWMVSMIPAVGVLLALIDTLFIFRSDRRCVHDLIASTKVMQVAKN